LASAWPWERNPSTDALCARPSAPSAAFGFSGRLVAGALASQLLAQIVYQATPRDPLVFAGVMITMAFLGIVATCIPAQRALPLIGRIAQTRMM